MLPAVEAAGFQFKNGAAFVRGEEYGEFDFDDKFTPGRNSTFQVERAKFDKLLADEAAKQGVDVRYEVRVGAVTAGAEPRVHAIEAGGREYDIAGRFILDAQRLRPHAAEAAAAGDAVEFPGAQRGLHARRRPHSGRRLRPQQDPGHRPPAARGRVVLADSVLRRAAARSAASRARSSSQRGPPISPSACASWSARSRSSRGCWQTRSGTRRRASCPATPPT